MTLLINNISTYRWSSGSPLTWEPSRSRGSTCTLASCLPRLSRWSLSHRDLIHMVIDRACHTHRIAGRTNSTGDSLDPLRSLRSRWSNRPRVTWMAVLSIFTISPSSSRIANRSLKIDRILASTYLCSTRRCCWNTAF